MLQTAVKWGFTKDLLNINKFWFEIWYKLSSWLPLREDRKCALRSHKAQSTFRTETYVIGKSHELCQPCQLRVTMLCIKDIWLKISQRRTDTLLHNISTYVLPKEFIYITFVQNWRLYKIYIHRCLTLKVFHITVQLKWQQWVNL